MSTISTGWTNPVGLSPETIDALQLFAKRRRVLLIVRAIAAAAIVLVTAMLLIAACDFVWLLSDPVRWALSACGYAVTLAAAWWFGLRHIGQHDPKQLARQLESVDPRLREDLLSAVELADPDQANGSESFRQRLQHSIARRTVMIDVARLLPLQMVYRWMIAGALLVSLAAMLTVIPQAQFARRFARAMLPGMAIQRASLTTLTIEAPSPPTGFVAQGDAVAVNVRMGGVLADEVTMIWRMRDGSEGETQMTPRSTASQTGEVSSDRYAANLLVGNDPVDYRIIAGDAITLWHTLTPLPRPRVKLFTKDYEFPSYAKIDNRIEESDHGDLEALVGTRAKLTITFDEAVDDAKLLFGARGPTYQLESVEGSREIFRTIVPIKTPGQYQIDATSSRSRLNNPFSPQYTITPIVDVAPRVRWSEQQPPSVLVSPLDVVSFSAFATDDLPMDRMVQEFQLNREPLTERSVAIEAAAREINVKWDWDLLHRATADKESAKLSGGDIIRTRLVAVDRLGQRGESPFIELLVADDDFDADRHKHLDSVSRLTGVVTEWADRAKAIFEQAKDPIQQGEADAIAVQRDAAMELAKTTAPLLKMIRRQTIASPSLAEARTIELIGRGLIDTDARMRNLFAAVDVAIAEQHPSWKGQRENKLRDLSNNSQRFAQQASRIERLMRAEFAQRFTLATSSDVYSLRRSLRPLVGDKSSIPIDRFSRYLTVVTGRLEAIDRLVEQHSAMLPESTRRHFEQWTNWSQNWGTRLRDLSIEAPAEDQFRSIVRQFDAETDGKYVHSMIDGQVASTLHQMSREIMNEIGSLANLIETMKRAGETGNQSRDRIKNENNSDQAGQWIRDASYADHEFASARTHLAERVEGESTLHRELPSVDLQYAADLNLIGRAIDNVAGSGFANYRDEPAGEVHQKLTVAFKLIEGNHEAGMLLRELKALADAERRLRGGAISKIEHSNWIQRFGTLMEWPSQTMQQSGLDWKQIEPIDRSRYNDTFNQSRDRITRRLWSGDDIVSAESPLQTLVTGMETGLSAIGPKVDEARQTILNYVLTLPEQAAKAAEEAKQAKQENEKRQDDSAKEAERLAEQQEEAQQDAKETLEALVDFANTAELDQAEQRELARDADAASAQIQDAMKRADQAVDAAKEAADDGERKESLDQNAAALEDLAKSLEQTSEHFQKAAEGQDVSESREQLRKAEAELEIDQQLQERFDRAKAMADAAQGSPEELMERLEKELQRNEPMQNELSEISKQAAKTAQASLEQSARDEANVNQSLERSDASFQESKARAARELANLARRSASVDQSLLSSAERAAGSAETPAAIEQARKAHEVLRDAVEEANRMGGEQAPLNKIQQTAQQMSKAIDQANEALKKLDESASAAKDKPIYGDDKQRLERESQQFERMERDARTQRTRAANQEQQDWSNAQRDADRRMQQAQRQLRDVERRKEEVEKRIKKEENNREGLDNQLADLNRQADEMKESEQSARESSDFAKERADEAREREKELGRQRLDKLDMPNPAAQLTERMAEQATEELAQIQQQLKELSQIGEKAAELRAPKQQAESLTRQQNQIAGDVNEAVEQLQRAARHEQRLGNQQPAGQLDQVAEQVAEGAKQAAEDAADALQEATEQSEKSAAANQKVTEAEQKIRDAAKSVAQVGEAQEQPGQPSPDAQAAEGAGEERARQLAQTLDELDRAMAKSEQGEGEQGEQAQGEQGQPGQQPGSEPGGKPSGKPSSAAQASPTLASMMEAQSQNAARQRQQQLNPSPAGEGEPSDDPTASGQPATESGSGEMPGGGMVDTAGVERIGDPWGQLRERRTDDAAESSAPNVPAQYRKEIEAYFRAIARQAAEKE